MPPEVKQQPISSCRIHSSACSSGLKSQDDTGRRAVMGIKRRTWNCPVCGRSYQIPATVPDPDICPECRTNFRPDDANHLSFVTSVVVIVLLSVSMSLIIIVIGVSATSIVLALLNIVFAVLFYLYAYSPQGALFIRRAITRFKEWNEERIEKKRRIEEDKQRHAMEEQCQREMEHRKRQKEVDNAMRPADIRWESKPTANADKTITYGIGREYVYCYTFPKTFELARITQQSRYDIKVGMTSNHPIDRVYEQVSKSQTAMSEAALVLLVFQTSDCRNLEKWLHKRLERVPMSIGREWFVTNPEELIRLFRLYLHEDIIP